MRIVFLIPSLKLSGGLNVVMEHGSRLVRDHGFDVTMAITHHPGEDPWPYEGLGDVRVTDIADLGGEAFDLAIATWWDTVAHLPRVSAKHAAYFVQSLEDRFFAPDDPQSALAGLTYRLGLPIVTEARWIADFFGALDPALPCFYVRNGVNKNVFPEQPEVNTRVPGPLRILIEGNVDDHIKGVPEALEAVNRMTESAQVTVVAARGAGVDLGVNVIGPLLQGELSTVMSQTDVVLKLSRVEGMSGPALEGFHRGATCVLTPVTGHDEYLQHGWNGLLTGWDDPSGTARQLDLLARDGRLLHFLRTNAASTARAWPGWEQAATMMAGALRSLAEAPGPDVAALAPLLREARFQIARDSRIRHNLKGKVTADGAHIVKLEAAWEEAAHRAHESGVLAAAREANLRRIESMLTELESSKWVRALDLVERPVRKRRPGLGSVRQRLRSIRDRSQGSRGQS